MEVEKAEDIEGAKGRTSSRMGITGAAKFARRSLQNGTRNFNLKNVWQVKEPTGAFFGCVARKGVTDVFFASVARKEVSRSWVEPRKRYIMLVTEKSGKIGENWRVDGTGAS